VRFEECCAAEVSVLFRIGRMSRAIDLDDEPFLSTREVGKVRADWLLTDEFEPAQAASS
jgi:hypothetical protein